MKEKKKAVNPMVRRRKNHSALRFAIQVIFFFVAPSAYASAFSGLKEVGTEFSQGAVLEWTAFTSILVFLLAFTIVFGRFFCGYACAFGAMGDWVYFVSGLLQKKFLGRKQLFSVPEAAVKWFQYVKYAVLLAVLMLCVMGKQNTVNENSPWTVFAFLSAGNMVPTGMEIGIVLFVLIVCGMAVKERFFCQFLCPMGAIFSLLPILPTGTLQRNTQNCISGCSACSRVCPVDITLEAESLKSGECIRCGKCSGICPKQNITLSDYPRKGMEGWIAVVQAAALLAGILIL